MTITVCVPSRGRPGRFAEMYDSLQATKGKGDVEVIVVVDEDDETRGDYPKGPTYIVRSAGPISTDVWNTAWNAGSGDIAMLGADDICFRTPGWNDAVEAAFEVWDDRLGLVYTNDLNPVTGWTPEVIEGWSPGGEVVEWRGKKFWKSETGLVWPTHLFVSREWTQVVGYFTPPYFSPTWEADTWVFLVAQEVRRVQYLSDVVIEHLHPMNGSAEMDETYARGTWGNPQLKRVGERKLRSRPMVSERDEQARMLRDAMAPPPRRAHDLPHTIHQIWLGPRPAPEAWMATWREMNPTWRYRLWREKDVDGFGLVNRGVYDRLIAKGFYDGASDVVRAEVLERFGGVYIDADSRALKPLEGAPFLRSAFFLMREESPKHRDLLNGCFMGSEAHHPILKEYIWALGQVRSLAPPWRTVGPGLLTKVVTKMSGADVLPPSTFFANGHLTGYGEHFWGSTGGRKPGYAGKPYGAARPLGNLSILVAFRDDDAGIRTRVWDFLRERLEREFPEVQIVVDTDDGMPMNKCMALNRAAARASGDLFLIMDSDTWIQPWLVYEARDIIEVDPRAWVKPWKVKRRLNEATSLTVLEQGSRWDGETPPGARFENVNVFRRSPPLMVSRELWESVGGMPSEFAGWGGEDSAFCFSLEAFYGSSRLIGGDCVHLWHPRLGKVGRDMWKGQESPGTNDDLYKTYERAARSPERMRDLIESRKGATWHSSTRTI